MRMLMPSHAKNVKPYRDIQPLFSRYGIESQLDAMFSPTVQLRSGGYIVINQAEALVAIDVNSGRATREHHIEDTALKTNLEASEEVARQLRMRDLAGLIVIDFIDMEEKRNNRAVERRLKECLKHDRARIQVGGISHFGLLEMSRQRIRTSVLESSTEKCPACGGTGHVRSVSSVALQLLRSLEETLIKSATHNLIVRTRAEVAIYVLNHKRAHLRALEERFRVTLTVTTDPTITGQISFVIDRGEQVHTVEAAKAILAIQPEYVQLEPEDEEEADIGDEDEDESEAEGEGETKAATERTEHSMGSDAQPRAEGVHEDGTPRRKRRRRRRRGGSEGQENREPGAPNRPAAMQSPAFEGQASDQQAEDSEAGYEGENAPMEGGAMPAGENGQPRPDGEPRRRRRGRRGGRRNRRDREGGPPNGEESQGEQPFHATPDIAEATRVPRIEPSAVGRETNYAPPMESFSQPAAPPPRIEGSEAPPAEAPKRRSTVREPATAFLGGQGAETKPQSQSAPASNSAPEPSDSADPNKPRKTGWWAKRLMGGNS
jgi:ribonuclease E